MLGMTDLGFRVGLALVFLKKYFIKFFGEVLDAIADLMIAL